jgi:hypothetical protein
VRRKPAVYAGRLALRVLAVQMAIAALFMVVVMFAAGQDAAISLLLGALVVSVPQWCAHQLLRLGQFGLPRLFALEGLRVGATVALLLYGARSFPGFAWWAALTGLILAVKAPWFVLLKEDRNS